MKRTELLNTLNSLRPALANNDLVPALSMFWFRDGQVMAFNDQIAIQTPMDTDFVGAVPGGTLIGMLGSSTSAEVDLSFTKSAANLKMGKTRLKLSYLPEEDFDFFKMPKSDKKNNLLVVDPTQFLVGVESCLRSIGTDVAVPDQLGITLIRKKMKLHLYSTDRVTLSHAEVDILEEPPMDEGERIILSASFCKQVLKLLNWRTKARYLDEDEDEGESEGDGANKKESTDAPEFLDLELAEKHALLTIGDTKLFGRLIWSDNPVDFEGVYNQFASKEVLKGLVGMPPDVPLALDRADIIVRTSVEPVGTLVEVSEASGGMKATFYSATSQGEITDTFQLGKDHPEVSLQITPRLVKKGCAFFNQITFSKRATIFKRGRLSYLVSAFKSG